jgi:ribonucleoside-diphosphate reductase alpha chain
MAKEGSTLSGVMDGFALTLSIGLQYGLPLRALVDKLMNTRFEPSGFTHTPDIRMASSVLDYIARWLGGKFISTDYLKLHDQMIGDVMGAPSLPATPPQMAPPPVTAAPAEPQPTTSRASFNARNITSAPTCSTCGMLMTPNGSCYKCSNCGGTSGCS